MPILRVLALALACLGSACASVRSQTASTTPAPSEPTPADLLAADRAFAADCEQRGLDGWMAWMAPDAVRLPELGSPPIRGLEAIRKADASLFSNPELQLTWEPTDAGLFSDLRHGFTTGRFEVLQRAADGSTRPVRGGTYLTFWRRGPDGEWRVILDTGAPDPA